MTADALSWRALAIGLALSALFPPLRIGVVWLQRRVFLHEERESSLRVSMALAPTLIFTLVLAATLRDRYGVDPSLYGGLLVYAALSTALPSALLKGQADYGLLLDGEMPGSPLRKGTQTASPGKGAPSAGGSGAPPPARTGTTDRSESSDATPRQRPVG